jgi:precorrin-2/cobalt-factor-2 C20-methyltransferase
MPKLGTFYGVGVGPGPAGSISVAALDALRDADVIFHPRARSVQHSVAKQCLSGLDLPEDRFREIIYSMDPDRVQMGEHYAKLAEEIAVELRMGKNVAYLTIGDALTYSTYNYTIGALLAILPGLSHQTFPGITSYAAIASCFDWPLGQGKERTLILPCPDSMDDLRKDIETHDVVVLMKIGHRFSRVLELLRSMDISQHCVFGSRIGLSGEYLSDDLNRLNQAESLGYLSTMLIRREPLPLVSELPLASGNTAALQAPTTESA